MVWRRVAITLFLSAALSSCASTGATAVKTDEVQLGVSEAQLKASTDSFAFAANGHFGDKVQYNSRVADANGGAYAIHCRKGKSFGIEVKYPSSGILASAAKSTLQRLIPTSAGTLVTRNDDDLKRGDCKSAAEFLYYSNRVRAELLYAENSHTRVREINVWSQ